MSWMWTSLRLESSSVLSLVKWNQLVKHVFLLICPDAFHEGSGFVQAALADAFAEHLALADSLD